MERKSIIVLILFLCYAFAPSASQAREPGWDAVGIRVGADLTDRHRSQDTFELYEMFLNYVLPWKVGDAPGLELRTRVDASAGALKRKDDTGFEGSVGPTLALGMFSDRVELEGGVAVGYLSRYHFPMRNLGGPVQFFLHGGLALYPLSKIGVSYRFEHISNSDLYSPNPGLNLHIVDLRYRF